ncbi:MAG: cyclophilin-like fold protein [Microvirga sp.]|jgi:hypothetical protein
MGDQVRNGLAPLLRETVPGRIAAPRQDLKGRHQMQHRIMIAVGLALMLKGNAMAQERILISSEWGNVTADLIGNDATRTLVRMLPLTIDMTDHLRQEKTGNLPSPLPATARQQDFSTGTLGLWGPDHFVIYYRSGRVPRPGIIILGNVTGDSSIFDRPGPVTIRLERTK